MNVNHREIYRYLGLGSKEPDERTSGLVESCLAELENAISPRFFSRVYPLQILPDGTIDFSCFTVTSRSLAKNLDGCEQIILFAATLGMGVDHLLRRYSRIEMSRAVVMQAASAALIEAYCNEENAKLKEQAGQKGFYLRPRFSPGYGDFSLSCQKELLGVLEAEKTVGITLTDSLLMMPSKSVSAVIGMGREYVNCEEEGCEACGSKSCPFRRG